MRFRTEDQTALLPHVRAELNPPHDVHTALNAVADPSDIIQSVARYERGKPTIWRVWALTNRAIVSVVVKYDELDYTAERANDTYYQNYPPVPQVEAISRPLHSIASLRVKASGRDSRDFSAPRATEFSLAFTDGSTLKLPDLDTAFDDDVRARTEVLLAAVRKAL